MRESEMVRLWLVLNLIDLVTTLIGLEQGYTEANPIISGIRIPEVAFFKIGLSIVVLVWLVKVKRFYLLKPLCIGMGLIVVWTLLVVGGII